MKIQAPVPNARRGRAASISGGGWIVPRIESVATKASPAISETGTLPMNPVTNATDHGAPMAVAQLISASMRTASPAAKPSESPASRNRRMVMNT